MAIDTTAPRTRRALLAGGLAGLATFVASALGRPAPAYAGTDGDVVLGATNNATTTTTIRTTTDSGPAMWVDSVDGHGIWGSSKSRYGVGGYSESDYGVLASSLTHSAVAAESGATANAAIYARSTGESTAVLGFSGKTWPLPAVPPKTGLYGYAIQDSDSRGVHGRSTVGRGVFGQATSGLGVRGYATSGVGVSAEATTGYAIRSAGRIRFDKASGVATIKAATASVPVPVDVDLTSASFVLLTPRGNLGGRSLWYTVDLANDRFTIRVSSAVSSDLKVGWMVLG
jgi:hypothetical protein